MTVRVQEVGSGPAVLFVHGVNTSGLSWAALAARMRDFRCILLDRPGTGLSEPLPGRPDIPSLERAADTLLVDVLNALELRSAHLVATSLGGYFALRSVVASPDRFGRMVQFSWPAGTPIDKIPLSMRINSVPVVGRLLRALPPSERSIRAVFRMIGHGPSLAAGSISDEEIAAYLALLRYTDTTKHDLALGPVLMSPVGGLERFLLPERVLRSVAIPTLFIWGERDPFGGAEAARRVVALMPDAELELLPAGHAPWLDDLERCASLTTGFLRAA